jgi:Signal transduction histidine kinase regulating citrate/malate metabolism
MVNLMGEIISVAVIMAIQALFITKILEIEKRSLFILLYCVVTVFTHLLGVRFWSGPMVFVKMMGNFGVRLLLIRLFARGRMRRLIFAMICFFVSEVLTEIFLAALVTLFVPLKIIMSTEDASVRMLFRIISLPVFLLINQALYRIWNKSVSGNDDIEFKTFTTFALSQALILSVMCILLCSVGEILHIQRVLLLFSVAACGICDIFAFHSIRRLSMVHMLEKDYLSTQNQLNVQLSYYNNLTSHVQHMNKLRHDFQNQIQTAYSLFKNDRQDIALSHLQEIEKLLSVKETKFCANPIIDAIMIDKSEICEEYEVRLQADCRLDASIPIEGFALCSIFANIMDNAIEACSKLEPRDREIKMAAYDKAGWLVISCENKSDAAAAQDKKKQLLPEHGLGLLIIEELVEKYDGKIQCTEDDGKFKITVWLSCSDT